MILLVHTYPVLMKNSNWTTWISFSKSYDKYMPQDRANFDVASKSTYGIYLEKNIINTFKYWKLRQSHFQVSQNWQENNAGK